MQQQTTDTSVTNVQTVRYENDNILNVDDLLAVEEPLEIRLTYGSLMNRKTQSISVTMRTPGNDVELALGFLFTEGIIESSDQVVRANHTAFAKTTASKNNIIIVSVKEDIELDLEKLKRNFYTTSSCGVCGKESIDAVKLECPLYEKQEWTIESDTILKLPNTLRKQQAVFTNTGGIHAAALFDQNGKLLLLREDVGRHNALDKLIGAVFFNEEYGGIVVAKSILLLSGRASFELVQKAAMAGVSAICAVGAPSSLAVQMAKDFKITLIGFLRENRFNIYNAAERVIVNK